VSTAPQTTRLQVTQSPVQTVTPGQQMVVRSVTQSLPVQTLTSQALSAQGIKTVVTMPDRPVQGMSGLLK